MIRNHLPTPSSLTLQQKKGLPRKPEKFSSYASSWPGHPSRNALPPVSVPELTKDRKRPRLTQCMRLILSRLKAYARLRAGEVGKVPRPVEFKGQVANNMMDPGEQLAWRTRDCVNQS